MKNTITVGTVITTSKKLEKLVKYASRNIEYVPVPQINVLVQNIITLARDAERQFKSMPISELLPTTVSYDENGFDEKGFDENGFDVDGYNADGYDRDGYDRDGYDPEGFDENGFDVDGYNLSRRL